SYAFDTAADNADNEEETAEGEEGGDTGDGNTDAEATERQNDPHYVEYYLRQIPKNDQERQIANDVIQEGLYNMGIILKDKLEDFPAARHEFDRLLTRYPDNIYRLDTYYNLYLMAVREGNISEAEHWRNLIVNDFADSPYGQAMRDPRYIENLREMDARQDALYEAAYQAYINNNNAAVHRAYEEMSYDFPMSKLMPKFMFINALSYVTENKPEQFKEVLTDMLQRYPDTDLTPYAAAYIKGLNAGRKLNSGSANMRGMLWETRLSNDSTAVDSDNPLEFDLNPDDEQLFILLYPTDRVSPNSLLYDIARHNFSSFVVKDFDLEQMNFGRLGLLIIKPFANVAEVNHYRSVLYSDPNLRLPPEVRPVVISAKNFDTLLHGGGSFDDYFRYVEDKTYRDTEESVLPPEFFGPSEGIIDEAPEAAEEEPAPASVEEATPSIEEEAAPAIEEEIPAAPQPEQSPELAPAPAAADEPVKESPTSPTGPTRPEAPATTPEAPASPAPPATTPAVAPPAPTAPAAPKPVLPEYPAGSEGDDDPLLD
ncbi:MAG: hypothetical protein K2L73_01410, partial [Muribaculaceae bacterium]|nr:hypothetical protein [Muribaculaceae bacterium]